MGLNRHFLGSLQPALVSATDYIVDRYASAAELDLSSVLIVVPGARAARRLDEDESLRRRLVAAGLQRAPAFNVPRLVDGHLRAFAAARNRYNPARAWWNERVRLPRSLRPRAALTPPERAAAAALLRRRSQLPAGCETLFP